MSEVTPSIIVTLVLIVILFVWNKEREEKRAAKVQRDAEGLPERHCLACGTDFNTRLGAWRGNTGIEVVLYVAGLVPGLVYSIWRRGGTPQHQCPACGSRHTVPYGSPAAAANRRKLGLGTVKS